MHINVTIDGDRVVLEGLDALKKQFPHAIQRGLTRSVKGIERYASDFLGGSGAKGHYPKGRWKKRKDQIPSGGYPPVPTRTGNLQRLLDFVEPGQTKSKNGFSITAEPMEAIVYNSAEYARVIHEGTGSSAKFGPRRFLYDALEQFNQGNRIAEIVGEEIEKEIKERGF